MPVRNFTLERMSLPGSTDQIEFISVPETCIVVYIDNLGNLTLVRQFREIFGTYTLELPGGGREKDEGSQECAIREFREETGMQLRNVRLLTTAALSVGTSDELVSIYLAEDIDCQTVEIPQLECKSVPFTMALELLSSEKILDAKTLLGVTLAAVESSRV